MSDVAFTHCLAVAATAQLQQSPHFFIQCHSCNTAYAIATVTKSLSNKTAAAERGYAAEYRPMQPRQPIYSASVLQFKGGYSHGLGITPVLVFHPSLVTAEMYSGRLEEGYKHAVLSPTTRA